MAAPESLRNQRRWCGIALRVTWLTLILAACWGFHSNVRTGFMVLLVGFSLIVPQLLFRDSICRRMEQRRKLQRIKEDPAEERTETAGALRGK